MPRGRPSRHFVGGRLRQKLCFWTDPGQYYPAIAELSYTWGFIEDPRWIQARLCFKVAESKILNALNYLKKNGLLRGSNPEAVRVKTDDEISSHVYKRFALKQCELARTAIDRQPSTDREVFNLTISVDAAKFKVAKEMIREFRHKLHDTLAGLEPANRVIQINMQMFSLSREEREKQ